MGRMRWLAALSALAGCNQLWGLRDFGGGLWTDASVGLQASPFQVPWTGGLLDAAHPNAVYYLAYQSAGYDYLSDFASRANVPLAPGGVTMIAVSAAPVQRGSCGHLVDHGKTESERLTVLTGLPAGAASWRISAAPAELVTTAQFVLAQQDVSTFPSDTDHSSVMYGNPFSGYLLVASMNVSVGSGFNFAATQ